MNVNSALERMKARKHWNSICKELEEREKKKKKNKQLRLLYPAKLSFKTAGEIQTFPDKQKHMLLAKSLTKKYKRKFFRIKARGHSHFNTHTHLNK